VLAELAERCGAPSELWLTDYRQSRVVGFRSGAELPVDDSWVGRCFAAQVPVVEESRTAVPVTTGGNRLGVLSVETRLAELTELLGTGALLAQAVQSATPATSVYETARRRQPMTVAAELQWALLPGSSYADEDVTVGALLEPAYSIAGDCYDWSRDESAIHLAILDGTGRGVPAALATTLALGALRNARYTGSSLADQAALADQAVYAQHGGDAFASALLLQLDARKGHARVVDAGSPLLFRQREGRVERIELDAQLPLGMFEETLYVEQTLDLEPGDRLLVVSDGVHGVVLDGAAFGGNGVQQALREGRLLSPAEVCRHILRGLRGAWGDDGPSDDAVVLCLDWHPRLASA
jgi:serine phosphatase RsbU (regulator of sigma subunit)